MHKWQDKANEKHVMNLGNDSMKNVFLTQNKNEG
jgi:hypothetical protein